MTGLRDVSSTTAGLSESTSCFRARQCARAANHRSHVRTLSFRPAIALKPVIQKRKGYDSIEFEMPKRRPVLPGPFASGWERTMKILLLTLLFTVFATTAFAGGENTSLLRCGIKFGGGNSVYEASIGSKQSKASGTYRGAVSGRFRSVAFSTTSATAFTAVKSKSSGRKTPPAIMLANIGCSWR